MSYGKPEAIDAAEFDRRYKKYLKMVAKRRRRRLAKRLMDKAPRKDEYYGWSM